MPVLIGIDVVGIQPFVFGSNKLRDVVGASALVDWATSKEQPTLDTKGGALSGLPPDDVLMAAGGNAIVRFDGVNAEDASRDFVSKYTRSLFDEAPGLEVAIARRSYNKDGKTGELALALSALQIDLAREKSERRPHAPLLGLSVTATCVNTGLPAVLVPHNPDVLISRQAQAMRGEGLRAKAKQRWRKFLKAIAAKDSFEFPDELDELGSSTGERSLLGVVHVDGNSIGKRIKAWTERVKGQPDEDVLKQYGEWSGDLIRVGKAALEAVVQRAFDCLSPDPSDGSVRWLGREDLNGKTGRAERLKFKLDRLSAKQQGEDQTGKLEWWLPIRPVLLGGDDLTFLCDGRIALDLAATAIRAIEGVPVHHLFEADTQCADPKCADAGIEHGHIKACAGVAIVPHHSPFIRSYELAEQLCQSAKKVAREHAKTQSSGASFIDWHIGLPKPSVELTEVRSREYRSQDRQHSLTCRPYRLGGKDAVEVGTWAWLDQMLLDDPQSGLRGKLWSEHRNKAKELREILLGGPDSIKDALHRWQIVTRDLKFVEGDALIAFENGFFNGSSATPLLDALELLDLHLPLEAGA